MLTRRGQSVLVLGYGNPGRLDDGLGPAFAERIQTLGISGVTVDSDYQLNVEDAALIARHDLVLFADASRDGPEPFEIKTVEARDGGLGFSSHSISAENLLGLAASLFKASTRARMLAIRGYDFDAFGERLSECARANLDAAVIYAERILRESAADGAAFD